MWSNFSWKEGLSQTTSNEDVAQLLLNRGADPNMADKYGGTPLSKVLLMGYKDVANILSRLRERDRRLSLRGDLDLDLWRETLASMASSSRRALGGAFDPSSLVAAILSMMTLGFEDPDGNISAIYPCTSFCMDRDSRQNSDRGG